MSTEIADATRPAAVPGIVGGEAAERAVQAVGVCRRFGEKVALDDVSFSVKRGEIHTLLGPNGAGKTTLLRVLTGLLHADSGTVRTAGFDPVANPRALRQQVGLIPSGDRTFYYRLSGLENLVFFARLYGLRRREAVTRAEDLMERVGLGDALRVRVGVYSHGMQKRLSVARSLLASPTVLLVDEATHDLDPEGSKRVRELVAGLAREGLAVIWTTQRVEEIRGFADRVTLLREGRVVFHGTVPALITHANPRHFLLHLRTDGRAASPDELSLIVGLLGGVARAQEDDDEHYLLSLAPDAQLGQAIAALNNSGVAVLSCTEEQSKIEQAFISLTGSVDPEPNAEEGDRP